MQRPLYWRLASQLFKRIRLRLAGLRHVSDTQCGFKAYRGGVARNAFALAPVDRFMFDVEILYLAEPAGLRILEIPVRWTDVPGSRVRVWEGMFHILRDRWRIRQSRSPIDH